MRTLVRLLTQTGTFAVALISAVTIFSCRADADAPALSEMALYYRCYTQLTGTRPKATDTMTLAVKNGSVTAVDQCMAVFNRAKFNTSTNQVNSTTDTVALSVLATFQRLHSSWFLAKDYPVVSWPGHSMDLKDIYDATEPALYYTRMLFNSTLTPDYPLTSTDFLTAVRSQMDPAKGPESGHPKADFTFTPTITFAPVGPLYGVQTKANVVEGSRTNQGGASVDTNSNPLPIVNVDMYMNYGGGYMGNTAYLSLNTEPISSYAKYATDGGLKMHRRYGKALLHDALCRELPVVREGDGKQYVDPNSQVAFRTASTCVQCHVSHDRISSVVRGMYVVYRGTGDPTGIGNTLRGGVFPAFYTPTKPAETGWSSTPDTLYNLRPQNGTLFYRDYKGDLVDQPVTGLSDLGTQITARDDYYICMARRYYQYFTGIDVNTGDIFDPTQKTVLSSSDTDHRNFVVQLGKDLHTATTAHTANAMDNMIKSILSSATYRKSDFGVKK